MKKATIIIIHFLFIFIFSCCNNDSVNEEKTIDESQYLDQDSNCDPGYKGTCCDTDGRVLVETEKIYKYTYKTNYANSSDIEWTVVSGEIILIEGQGTSEATFYFAKGFIKGAISAHGKNPLEDSCQSTIFISKL